MITLIHGDDKAKVSGQYSSLLEQGIPKVEFDLKKDTPEQIERGLKSDTLFSEKKVIVLRSLNSLHHTKRKKLFELLKPYKGDANTSVILISETVLDKKVVPQVGADVTYSYELPKYFFEYLDALTPTKGQLASQLIQKLSKFTDGEQLFYSTVNRIRTLMLLKTDNPKEFEEIAKMSPYFESKLRAQAQKWKVDTLTSFYQSLFEIEVGLKTSSLPLEIAKHLDIAVIKHLK